MIVNILSEAGLNYFVISLQFAVGGWMICYCCELLLVRSECRSLLKLSCELGNIAFQHIFCIPYGIFQSLRNVYVTLVDGICNVRHALESVEHLSLITTTDWFPFPVLLL